ncbi:hypothetical protein Ptc2401_00792 [Prosthecochloris sp. CIB 2401]|nr:hypothetical protein Ptc2401_00792 [Prosthecochloris sp. CIB 2401]
MLVLFYIGFELFLEAAEREVPVEGFPEDRFGVGELAFRVFQLTRAEVGAALFALVTVGFFVAANGAGAGDVAVGEEALCLGVVELLFFFLPENALAVDFTEELGGGLVMEL